MNTDSPHHTLSLLGDSKLQPVPALDHDLVPDLAEDLGELLRVLGEPGPLAGPHLDQADLGPRGEGPEGVAVPLHGSDGVLGDVGEGPDDVPLLHLVGGDLPPQLVVVPRQGDHGLPQRVIPQLDHSLLQHCAITGEIRRDSGRKYIKDVYLTEKNFD